MSEYYLYSRTEWYGFGNRLIHKKSLRTDFFEACKNKKDFLVFLENYLKKPSGDKPPPILKDKLTEESFIKPPPNIQQKIYDIYKGIPDQYVHDHTFWLCVNIEMIKKSIIKSSFLANSKAFKGEQNLQRVTEGSTDDQNSDDIVRRILRRLCNAAPRGHRTLISLNDCPISAAYWRQALISLIRQASETSETRLKEEEISSQLDTDQYNNICDSLFSGKSYYGNPRILAGLVIFLKNQEDKPKNKEVKDLLKDMGKIIAWKAVDLLDIDEISKEFDILRNMRSNH